MSCVRFKEIVYDLVRGRTNKIAYTLPQEVYAGYFVL